MKARIGKETLPGLKIYLNGSPGSLDCPCQAVGKNKSNFLCSDGKQLARRKELGCDGRPNACSGFLRLYGFVLTGDYYHDFEGYYDLICFNKISVACLKKVQHPK